MLSYKIPYSCHFLVVLCLGTKIDYGTMFAEQKQLRIQNKK